MLDYFCIVPKHGAGKIHIVNKREFKLENHSPDSNQISKTKSVVWVIYVFYVKFISGRKVSILILNPDELWIA